MDQGKYHTMPRRGVEKACKVLSEKNFQPIMMGLLTPRVCFALILATCLFLLGFAWYLEHVGGLLPCPLCILQRLVYLAIAFWALLGLLHGPGPWGLRVYSIFLACFSLLGVGLAARQVYLQHLPAHRVPECGPDLAYMLDVFPWQEALVMMLRGSGDCAKVQWRFLALSIPEWSLVLFSLLFVVAACLFFFARRLVSS